MITAITVKCDVPGCPATLTFDFGTMQPGHSWKAETDGVYSLHLCPAHKRMKFDEVKQAQVAAYKSHSSRPHMPEKTSEG